ncbi:MAG: hypothetical protein WBN10_00395 [Polyangiales bacterium]
MKPGIVIIGMAALGLGLFVTGGVEANWWGGPDVNQRIYGHSINIGDDVATGNSTILQSGIAKGKPGKAQVTASLVRETEFVFNPDGNCPEGFPLESQLVSFSWGETYSDGSLLAGNAVAVPGQVVCLDLEQTALVGDLSGSITGGAGRFQGASGSWNIGDAVVPIGTSITTARLFVDLD